MSAIRSQDFGLWTLDSRPGVLMSCSQGQTSAILDCICVNGKPLTDYIDAGDQHLQQLITAIQVTITTLQACCTSNSQAIATLQGLIRIIQGRDHRAPNLLQYQHCRHCHPSGHHHHPARANHQSTKRPDHHPSAGTSPPHPDQKSGYHQPRNARCHQSSTQPAPGDCGSP